MDPLRGIPLLEDLPDLDGKRVLVRVDFNVPLHIGVRGRATVADDFRITAALPTLQSPAGRGRRRGGVLAPRPARRGRPTPAGRWTRCASAWRCCAPGVELTENLRFDPGEKANDPAFVQRLIEGFDAYVDEAFGAAHRAHASIVGPPQFLPSAAGLRFAREVEVLGGILEHPARPFVAVVGGAKVADKLEVLKVLATKVDTLVVGGGMAFTFLAAQGQHVGCSLLDRDHLEDCRALLDSGVRILLPTDTRALEPGGTFGPPSGGHGPRGSVKVIEGDLPDGWTGLDIGPDTAAAFAEEVATAGTVLWNGPLGAFEDHRFAAGTRIVAEAWPTAPASRWWAAATAPARWTSWGSRTRSATSRPAGERRCPSLRWRGTSRASTPCARPPTHPGGDGAPPAGQRELEDAPRPHRGAAHGARPRPAAQARGRGPGRRVGPPSLHRPAHGADAGREGAHPGRPRRAALLRRGRRAAHR